MKTDDSDDKMVKTRHSAEHESSERNEFVTVGYRVRGRKIESDDGEEVSYEISICFCSMTALLIVFLSASLSGLFKRFLAVIMHKSYGDVWEKHTGKL